VKPTSTRLLVILAILGAAGGWALVVIIQGWSGRALPVPVLAGSALWLLGIAFIIWGSVVGPRLRARIDPMVHPGVEPLPGLVAARVAAIAMAASRVGAFVCGIYAGLALATVAGGLSTPASAQAFWASLLAASGSALTCVAAIRLERSCLLPSNVQNEDE
jgi:hypothetical protein